MKMSGSSGYVMLALGIVMFAFITFIVWMALSTDPMAWETIGSIEMQDVQSILYDRNRQIRLKVNAQLNNYARFY